MEPKESLEKSTLESVFSLFLSTDDDYPNIQKPFQFDGKTYATNGVALIRCDNKYCDFKVDNQYSPASLNTPTPNENTRLILDSSIFEYYKTEDEYEYIGKDIDCDLCKCEGRVRWRFENHEKMDECPVCLGSGQILRMKVKTGNKGFGNSIVLLNGHIIYMTYFYKLIKAGKALGHDIFLIYQSAQNVMFRISNCEFVFYTELDRHVLELNDVLVMEIDTN